MGDAERDYPEPRQIPLPADGEPCGVSAGALHTAVLTERGEVLTFGWGAAGALGHGGFGYELEPRAVEALRSIRATSISAGARHTVAVQAAASTGGPSLARDFGRLLRAGTGADVAVVAGKGPGRRRFLLHRAVLACRCPRLLAMAALSSRFCRGAPAAEEPREWEWHRPEGRCYEGGWPPPDCLPALGLPECRAPIFALLATWLYTGRLLCSERLFLEQLADAAASLRLRALVAECRRLIGSTLWPGDAASPHDDLGASFARLLLEASSGPADDVCLRAVDGEVGASRALLCARSEFFRSALQGGFHQLPTIDLQWTGVGRHELRQLLSFVYSGRVVASGSEGRGDLALLSPEAALSLLPLAAALLLDGLQRLSEAVLSAVVDEENASALLEVADQCYASRLKATCSEVLRS